MGTATPLLASEDECRMGIPQRDVTLAPPCPSRRTRDSAALAGMGQGLEPRVTLPSSLGYLGSKPECRVVQTPPG